MPYTDAGLPHAGSSEVLFSGMFDEPAGTIARTIPRGQISNAGLVTYNTGGQVAVRAIPLPAGLVVRNIMTLFGGTGATGPTHFWTGLTDAQLNVLAVSADQGSAAQTASTYAQLAMGNPFVVQYTGLYYVAVSSSASTTAPTGAGIGLAASVQNSAPILCGTAGTQATPPAIGSQINSGNISNNGNQNIAAWIS